MLLQHFDSTSRHHILYYAYSNIAIVLITRFNGL